MKEELVDLLDITSEALFEIGPDFTVIFVNRKIADVCGWEASEVRGKSFLTLFPEQNRQAISSALEAAFRAGGILSIKVPLLTREGVIIGGHLKVIPVELPGYGRGFRASLVPRHKSYLAEEILEGLDTGVVLLDKRGRVLYANRYAQQHLSAIPRLLEAAKKSSGSDEEIRVDDRVYTMSAKPFKHEPGMVGWTVLFKDITEIKKMHQMMTMVDRLSSLGIIAASIAHEVKNPLAGVRIMAQTLYKELEPEKREYAARIMKQIDKIDSMIKKLLSYAKPKAPQPVPFNLHSVVEEVVAVLRGRAERSGIKINLSINPAIVVTADPAQIQQVIMNLILNSIEVMEKTGGIISIEAGESTIVNPDLGKPYIFLKVRDNGPGIPHEAQQKVFYPFYTTKEGGTGLGLFVVYQLVKENGGMVEVQSEPGKGTEFIVYLKPAKGGSYGRT
ncbi:MAG: ATP-binding protein [candidate division WOR-3 bacterium]